MSYRFALPEAVRLRMDEKNAVRQQPVINACLCARRGDAAAGCLLASVLLAASAAMDSLSLSAISTDYFYIY